MRRPGETGSRTGWLRARADRSEYKTFGRSRSLRLPGFDYAQPYRLFYVTVCSKDRQRVFTAQGACAVTRGSLVESCARAGYRLIAYCVMPDHGHALVQGGPEPASLSSWVRRFKGASQQAMRKLGFAGKIWQRGFFDRVLRDYEDAVALGEYILGNPVRAAWWSSGASTSGRVWWRR